MFDEKEIEQLLKRAIERRVREILKLEGLSVEEQPEPQILRAKLAAIKARLAALWLRKWRTARRSRAWEWAKAWGMLLGPGMAFGLILSLVLHNWISAALPSVLIYLSLLWR